MTKRFLAVGLSALLGACGGGSGLDPIVTQIQAQSLHYGKSATIYVAGKFLRHDMIADTGSCTSPTFGATSTPDLAVLNCKPTAVGALPITIKSADGGVLYTATLTVPAPQVTLVTSKGSIVMELNPAVVPATVNNFLSYVNSGYYQSTLFHRVIAGFVVQGGGYTTGLVKKAGQSAAIALESNKGLSNARGTVAMARTNVADSATSEFYVNLADNLSLNYQSAASPGYAVFGKVIQGMDVVDTIATSPTGAVNGTTDVPTTDVTITYALQTQ
jgi:peptidyl-prolyl cis-trans isomerase A (cyclophilin A)